MIMFRSDTRPCSDTGVTGVGGTSLWSQASTFISSAFMIVKSARGFGTLLSTLSGLNGNSPLAAKLAIMFFEVKAFSLAGL
jgi:hypothetical protein